MSGRVMVEGAFSCTHHGPIIDRVPQCPLCFDALASQLAEAERERDKATVAAGELLAGAREIVEQRDAAEAQLAEAREALDAISRSHHIVTGARLAREALARLSPDSYSTTRADSS